MFMRKTQAKSIVAALGGHPPNTPLLDIAHGLNGTATRENIGKAMAGARAHNIKAIFPRRAMMMPATSFSKSLDMAGPSRAQRPSMSLAAIFKAPNPMRGTGYFAPRGRSFGAAAPAPSMAA